jgi:hypothetical protein
MSNYDQVGAQFKPLPVVGLPSVSPAHVPLDARPCSSANVFVCACRLIVGAKVLQAAHKLCRQQVGFACGLCKQQTCCLCEAPVTVAAGVVVA